MVVKLSCCHCCVRAPSNESGAVAFGIFPRSNLGGGDTLLKGACPRQAGAELTHAALGGRGPASQEPPDSLDMYLFWKPQREAGQSAEGLAQTVHTCPAVPNPRTCNSPLTPLPSSLRFVWLRFKEKQDPFRNKSETQPRDWMLEIGSL